MVLSFPAAGYISTRHRAARAAAEAVARGEKGMKAISAPWRMEYIKAEKPEGCVFCLDGEQAGDFVLKRGRRAFVMMNRYPYTAGHVMIIPYRHLSDPSQLTPEERLELFDLTALAVSALREAMGPEGFNIGMNLGKAAGAGIEDHLHIHVVPRWTGDTNFVSVVGEVRVIPEAVSATWEKLLPYFGKE